jgi:hypothetical protein
LKYDRFGEQLDKKGLEKLKSEMKVYEPTAEEMQKFRDKALPYVREWMEKKHGKKLVAEFFASIEAAEEQLRKEKESAKATRE